MKKRGIFPVVSIIFLLILAPNTFSIYEELVYSGTVEDRDIINISGHLFEFRMDSESNKAYVAIDISAVIVAGGECKIKDGFDICISNISFSYRNYTEYLDIYKALVNVYRVKSTLDVTNAIEKSNLLIDEETTATLTIENTADIVAKDVTAVINIPPHISVTEVDGCKKVSNSIIFEEDVYPRQIRTCTYKVRGLTGNDFELTANTTYFDGVEQTSASSNTINGKVYNYSLKISPKLNKTKFNIGEKLNLIIDIKNINDQYDLTITTFNIKLPYGLLLLKKPKVMTRNNRILSWRGTLAPEENKSFVIEFQSHMTGNYFVLAEASYKVDKFLRTANEPFNIAVYCDCPIMNHDFSQKITLPQQEVSLKAFITNPSKIHDFKNININYITNIPDIQDFSSVVYSKISPFESIKIFDSSITGPDLNETYYLNITATYESPENQVFIAHYDIPIKVLSEIEKKIEEIPQEEVTNITDQQEAEELQEVEKAALSEPIEEITNETEETETSEEILITTLKDEKETPIKTYALIALIAALVFMLVVTIILKRKKAESEVEQKANPSKKEEMDFKELERQIHSLGDAFESEKQEKTGSLGGFFKKR